MKTPCTVAADSPLKSLKDTAVQAAKPGHAGAGGCLVASRGGSDPGRRRLGEKLVAQGLESRSMKPGELVDFGRLEIDKRSDLVKRSGAQVD